MEDEDQPATKGDLRRLSELLTEAFDDKLEAQSRSLTDTFDVRPGDLLLASYDNGESRNAGMSPYSMVVA